MNEHLSDLWKIETIQRKKSIKLLNKICKNILSDPSDTKYHDLNFQRIKTKLNECESSIALLFDIGFKLSIHKTRLRWECNDVNVNLLLNLSQNLNQKMHSSMSQAIERKIYASTQHINMKQSLQIQFVPDLNFDVTRNDTNNDSSKHILYSSNLTMNAANDHMCNISICWSLRRITKILKQYHLYIQSKEDQNIVMELIEFGYEMNEIKAAIALSHENQKEQKNDNEICFEDIYGENE
eukprot:24092_1